MLEPVRKWLTVVIAIAALIGFVYFYGALVVGAITKAVPTFSTDQSTLATILSGLVGGIVAAGFGVAKPDNSGGGGRLTVKARSLGAFVQARANWASPQLVGSIYAAVYVVLGLLAIFVAYFYSTPPALLANLANVTIGLFIAIVTAFFSPTQ